ncbi:TBC-domain-containing protein [Martensiomyces pterosporus]|nr:TBC-domain-containing protein [Martensiomyces pterosporus]
MRELRVLIASNGGLPVNPLDYNSSKLRGIMWLAMLEVRDISAEGYRGALRRCPSVCASKINNDAFRTLAGDAEFRRCVTTESIVRVLNALLSAPDQSASDPPRYVQGMNTLLAPFLYVLGEGAAFHAFRQFLRNECPLYARPSLPGVHACVQLVDECLSFLDPRLYSHLKRHGAVAKIYAFPAAMTLSANVGPLRQVVRLWDFLLAFGVHLNVVCIVAQLLSMRELLVTTTSPMSFLRSWPPLRAESVIRRTRELYELIPDALKKRIKLHAHDPQLAEGLASAPQVPDPLLDGGQRVRVTSGDYSSLKRDLSPNLNNGNGSSTSSRNSSNGSGRPRAKTFSGTAGPKRMRTGGNNGLGGLPKYGAMGLGIMPVNSSADAGGGRPRVLSGGRRPVRGMRLAAGSEAMWLLDRKLSAEFNDTRPDRPQWLDLNPTIEQ